ncbi:MAG: FHA domain-containing protein [Peptococcia bacterium]
MLSQYCLIVNEGEPYRKGEKIPLSSKPVVLGRSSSNFTPDISFTSPYISRRHAKIIPKKNRYYLSDSDSTHGTMLNNKSLVPAEPCLLQDGDKIVLANGLVSLSFVIDSDNEATMLSLPKVFIQEEHSLAVDLAKRQAYVNGEPLTISGKPLDLLLLLYKHKNEAVSYDEIKKALWPERLTDEAGIPDVGHDEIGSLVYRLRKNLGTPYGSCITAIPRYGLVLDLEDKK